MEYIIDLIFWVVVAVVIGFFGSSRREEKRVDANKTVMRQNPSMRYGMYLVGVLISGMFLFFGTMAIQDGAQKEQPWIILLLLLGVLMGVGCFLAGYVFYARHVFFDEAELLVGRPFKKMLQVKWQEIGRMEWKKNKLLLYGADGVRLVSADVTWENFDLFSDMAKRMCSAKAAKKNSASALGDGERVMGRRAAGVAMFVLAVLLFFICAVGVFTGEYTLEDLFANRTMIFFPFLLVLGLASLFYAVFLFMEKVRYTKEEIVFCSLFGKKKFLWRSLQKIRKEEQGAAPVQKLYLTWEGKERVVSSTKYPGQFNEFLDFVIDIALTRNIPTQNL